MAALLVAMSVMAVLMSAALPAWRTWAQREKEAELIFRGEQYARAINLYQRRYANAAPPSIDVLVNERFLRKKYKDPITGEDFQVVTAGNAPGGGQTAQGSLTENPSTGRAQLTPSGRGGAGIAAGSQPGGVGGGGIVGVMSTSAERSFRVYNGREYYNQWVFMGVQQSTRAGGPGGAAGRQGADGRGADGRGGRGAQTPPRGRGPQPPPGDRGGFGGRVFQD